MNDRNRLPALLRTTLEKVVKNPQGVAALLIMLIVSLGCDSGLYKASAWLRYEDNLPTGLERTKEDRLRFEETQRRLILSPLVIEPVLARPDVARISEINTAESPVDLLLERLTMDISETNDLWIISCRANDPEDAATITNAVVESYFRILTQDTTSKTSRRIEQLQEERDQQVSQLQQLSTQLSEVETQNSANRSKLSKQWSEEALHRSFLRLREQQDVVALELAKLELQAGESRHPVAEVGTEKLNEKKEAKVTANSAPDKPAKKPLLLDVEQVATRAELQLQANALRTREAAVLKAAAELLNESKQGLDSQFKNDEYLALKSSIEKLSAEIRELQMIVRMPAPVTLLRQAEPPSQREAASP